MLTFGDELDRVKERGYNKLVFNKANALTETDGFRCRMLQRVGGWCEPAQFLFVRIPPEQAAEMKSRGMRYARKSKQTRYAPLQAEGLMES